MSSSSSAEVMTGACLPTAWNLVDLLDGAQSTGGPGEPCAGGDAAELALQNSLGAAAVEEEARLSEQADRERRIEEAHRRGFEEGRQEGEMMEQARLRGAVRAAEGALEELRLGEARWAGTIEENVCGLAVVIARQVIGRELQLDGNCVLEMVRSALAQFPIDQPMRIRVHPNDLSAVSRESVDGETPMSMVTRDRDARWVADAGIVPGGCVVEGRERIVDGRVDLALERIYRRLTYTHA